MWRDRWIVRSLCLILTLALFAPLAAAQTGLTREQAEEQGIDLPVERGAAPAPAPGPKRDRPPIPEGGLPDFLLIPDSTNDRVMSFDPTTGDLVDADFIPSDPGNLGTPIHAILSSGGDSILLSDQINDVVHEYALDGTYLGVFAPAGGADTSILDNIRGISLRANGNLLVTVGGGTNDDAVAEFDTSGNYLGNFVANASGGLDSPFDVLLGTDALVGGINSDAIHRYDVTTGAYIADLTAINSFPEQLAFASSNGNLLVANFSGTEEGIVEYMLDGTQVGIYDPASLGGYRGVYELPNGNLLVTNGSGVHEIDRMGNLVESKITSVSARFIELIQDAVPVELMSFTAE
jgi:hypothetical protein